MRTVILITGVLIIGVLIGLAGARFGEQVTVASLAPDEATRVWVVELPRFIDRNFAVRVEDLETGNLTTIFASPDEGRPVGSERIVWAADSSRFVLVGRYFYVHPEASLPSGESLKHCEECGDEIPEARRQAIAGVRLCVVCQQALDEHRASQGGINRRGSKDSQLR